MTTVNKVIQHYLEESFGSDIKNLKDIKLTYEEALQKKLKLEKQLSVVSTEVPTKIEEALSLAKTSVEKADNLLQEKDEFVVDIAKCVEWCATGVEQFQQSIDRINEIERYISYMKWVSTIEETSSGIQQYILSDSMDDACITFKKLVQHHTDMLNNATLCHNLIEFLRKTIMFWYDILREKLSKEFEGILKQISWPFISAPGPNKIETKCVNQDKTATPSPYTTPDPGSHMESIIRNLLNIQLRKQFRAEKVDDTPMFEATGEECKVNGIPTVTNNHDSHEQLLIPFQLLLRPLRKRFHFHFSGKKESNDLRKPEWYLAQILNWIGHHSGFLEHTIQPILDNCNHKHIDALVMFTQGLLRLVLVKLAEDMEEIIYSDDNFSHVVDEVLLFDRELRVAFNIPDVILRVYSPLIVFTQTPCMKKWLTIERISAVEKLDALLSSEEAWKSKFVLGDMDDADDMKTPHCAEVFVSMLLAITDRYKNLPSYHEQLQFLDLQLLLLDDFRIRLTQMIRSFPSNQFDEIITSILNAAFYITVVLREWADNVFFLELKYQRDRINGKVHDSSVPSKPLINWIDNGSGKRLSSASDTSTDDTVFESIVALYERIYHEGVQSICQSILGEFVTKSRPYLNDQWLALPLADEQVTLIISRSACGMLEVLQERLYLFERRLGTSLFSQLWKWVAEDVDAYLYQKVVLANHFNEGGALQLQFDMTRNLFPLFGPYTNKPDSYFRRMHEACLLLNLNRGSALLLNEVLIEETQAKNSGASRKKQSDPIAVLADVGVQWLKPSDAKLILNRRVDWTST